MIGTLHRRLAVTLLCARVFMAPALAQETPDAAAQANNPLANMTAFNMQDYYYRLSDNWIGGAGVFYRRLLNDAEDSPIVDERGDPDQFVGGAGVAYSW